jgi:cytochrome c-type biogenesis protein CcmH/NrfG
VSDREREERDHLEAERDVLLKSLDDLEVERADGNIDDESYRALHDDYTARAAAAIRALRDGVDARPVPPPTSGRRRALVIGGVLGFAALAAFGLAAALGARLPGQTSSGNTGPQTVRTERETSSRRTELEKAIAADPSDTASRLLLAPILEADGDLLGALQRYDEVIALNPQNAVAHAESGRILYLTARQASTAEAAALVDRSRARLDRAVELDPELADARLFRAIVLANEYGDFVGAQSDAQRYLVLAPNGRFADQARQLLADVTIALERSSATTTTSPQ